MSVERITDDMPEDWTRGHRFRYHLAAGFLSPDDAVLDAACGSGYGGDILRSGRPGLLYYGVDKTLTPDAVSRKDQMGILNGDIWTVDLETWSPGFDFDVFVGFETVEHLDDYHRYLLTAQQASKYVLLSVPIVPTVGTNLFHRHNFQRGQLVDEFLGRAPVWELFQTVDQPTEQSEIYVFMRSGS